MDSKYSDIHILDGWMPATKHTLHAPSTKTECDYLNDWIKKWSHTQKSHPKRVNSKDVDGNAEEEEEEEEEELRKLQVVYDTPWQVGNCVGSVSDCPWQVGNCVSSVWHYPWQVGSCVSSVWHCPWQVGNCVSSVWHYPWQVGSCVSSVWHYPWQVGSCVSSVWHYPWLVGNCVSGASNCPWQVGSCVSSVWHYPWLVGSCVSGASSCPWQVDHFFLVALCICMSKAQYVNFLDGLMVKTSACCAEAPRLKPGSSHYGDFNMVAWNQFFELAPWDWPGVSMQWLGAKASLMGHFYLSVAARKSSIVYPSPRYPLHVVGRLYKQQPWHKPPHVVFTQFQWSLYCESYKGHTLCFTT